MTFSNLNLTSEEVEELLLDAEQQARNYIYSILPQKEISNLNINIEFSTADELRVDCTIDLQLVKHSKVDPKKVTDEAIKKIFESIEKELSIKSQ